MRIAEWRMRNKIVFYSEIRNLKSAFVRTLEP